MPATLPIPAELFPHWARWCACDADGSCWCYEAEPHQHDVGWYENEVGRYRRIGNLRAVAGDWRNSLARIHNPGC